MRVARARSAERLGRMVLAVVLVCHGCDDGGGDGVDVDAGSDAAPSAADAGPSGDAQPDDGSVDVLADGGPLADAGAADASATVDAALPPIDIGPAPDHDGVFGFAHGCVSVEVFDGHRTLRHIAAGDAAFSFSDVPRGEAARFRLRPSDLGTYLFYDADRRYLTAAAEDGGWRFDRPDQLESEVERLELGFRSPAEWHLQASARDPDRFQLQHRATERYLAIGALVEDPSEAGIVTLHAAEGCADFPELTLDAEGEVEPRAWDDGDVYGIAEIHSHMLNEAAFGGGGMFHGASFHRLGVERALPDCERSHGPEGRRDIVGFFNDQNTGFDIQALLPVASTGEFEEFNHLTAGYPDFPDWPNAWRRSTHNTMYYRWLERAYLGGLRLMVQHATGNSVLCELTVGIGAQETLYSCNDMVSVDRAIERAHELERYIDAQSGGPGRGWFKIVGSPAEAREVIGEGKLAVVLGIEISNVFDCFVTEKEGFERCTADSVRAKLDAYHEKGVRVLFPVHKYDNAFSAGDGQGGMIELGNLVNSGHYSNFIADCPPISAAFDGGEVTFGGVNRPREVYDAPSVLDMAGFVMNPLRALAPVATAILEPSIPGEHCQQHGLTPLGETLMRELMARGMLIDVAHLPKWSLQRAYEILEEADYPATKTHGNSNDGRIYRLGGLVGTRLGRCADPNRPDAMTRDFTRAVDEAVENGAYPAEGLRFDLNGFAGGPLPRFGEDARCGGEQANPVEYPFTSYDGQITFTAPRLGNRDVDFNTEGMIHIGLLPELIEDARRGGATDEALEPLFRSAEAYIRMWEKAERRAAAMQE